VTDDLAERETVISLGGMASSCLNFIQTVENALAEIADDIKQHNRQENIGFSGKMTMRKSNIQDPSSKKSSAKIRAEQLAFEHVGSWILDLLWT